MTGTILKTVFCTISIEVVTWLHTHCGCLSSTCRRTQCPWSEREKSMVLADLTDQQCMILDYTCGLLTWITAMTRAPTITHFMFVSSTACNLGWQPCIKRTAEFSPVFLYTRWPPPTTFTFNWKHEDSPPGTLCCHQACSPSHSFWSGFYSRNLARTYHLAGRFSSQTSYLGHSTSAKR